MKVLVVDDDRVLSQLLTSRLRRKGLEVIVAFDAMQSMMLAIRNVPAVIILDINMPGGNGLDLLKRLKSFTKTAAIPVLILSSSLDPGLEGRVKELGAEEFFAKPPDLGQLEETLHRLLGIPVAQVS
jgi:two-component system, cell cycle response regulator